MTTIKTPASDRLRTLFDTITMGFVSEVRSPKKKFPCCAFRSFCLFLPPRQGRVWMYLGFGGFREGGRGVFRKGPARCAYEEGVASKLKTVADYKRQMGAALLLNFGS